MAELADAHGSGPCGLTSVEVRIFSRAPSNTVSVSVPCFFIIPDAAKKGEENHDLKTEDKKVIMDAPKEVKAKFYTIDFARKSNGKLVIMEMGDGQVSGLQGFDEQKFYDLLWENLPESRA